jgi:hypothetical protein
MSRKSVQRFCDNDMRKIKDLKRLKRILEIAMRFRRLLGKEKPPGRDCRRLDVSLRSVLSQEPTPTRDRPSLAG